MERVADTAHGVRTQEDLYDFARSVDWPLLLPDADRTMAGPRCSVASYAPLNHAHFCWPCMIHFCCCCALLIVARAAVKAVVDQNQPSRRQAANARPGDWVCTECGSLVFAKKVIPSLQLHTL